MQSEEDVLAGVTELLRHRNRHDLAQLLQRAWLIFEESNQYGSRLFSKLTAAHIHAPIEDYERLRSLSEYDQTEIVNTLREIVPPRDHSMEIASIDFVVDASAPENNNEV